MVLLRWSVGTVGAGSVPGGAVGGARGVGQLPLPAPTAPTLHLSRTILNKASRSATEEEDSDNFTDYLWLFRTRMPMLRRQDSL